MTRPKSDKIAFTRRLSSKLLEAMREIIRASPFKWSSETQYIEQAISEKNEREKQ